MLRDSICKSRINTFLGFAQYPLALQRGRLEENVKGKSEVDNESTAVGSWISLTTPTKSLRATNATVPHHFVNYRYPLAVRDHPDIGNYSRDGSAFLTHNSGRAHLSHYGTMHKSGLDARKGLGETFPSNRA